LQLAGAAGGAAAGGGGILSFLAPFLPFLAFDSGSWEVPHDMIAGVHAGEMIVPSQGGIADQFRGFLGGNGANGGPAGSSGGDTHVHLHLAAIDGASARSFLMNNSKHVAGALNAAVQRGDHLGLRSLGSR
jgi:hypothetical protein